MFPTGAAGDPGGRVHRSAGGFAILAVYLVFAVGCVTALATSGPSRDLPAALPLLAGTGVLAHAMFWRAAVVVRTSGVELRNILRDVHVPWAALRGVDTRWALSLVTDEGRHYSFSASAPGHPRRQRRLGRPARAADAVASADPAAVGGIAGGPERRGEAAAVAEAVEQAWDTWRRLPAASRPQDAAVTIRWNTVPILLAVALVSIGVVAWLLR